MLETLILLPLIGSLFILIIPKENVFLIRNLALNSSLLTFLVSVFLWISFDSFVSKFQFITKVQWLSSLNINFILGIDGIGTDKQDENIGPDTNCESLLEPPIGYNIRTQWYLANLNNRSRSVPRLIRLNVTRRKWIYVTDKLPLWSLGHPRQSAPVVMVH